MNTAHRQFLYLGILLLGLIPAAQAEDTCSCCAPKTTVTSTDATAAQSEGHPLRGVVVYILPAKQSLLVRHEEIPGVMRAMTMLLKTDTATLAAAIKGQSVTATLTKREDGWWISDVKPVPASP